VPQQEQTPGTATAVDDKKNKKIKHKNQMLLLLWIQVVWRLYRVHRKRMINFNNPSFAMDKDARSGAQQVPLAHGTDTEQGNVYESVA